MVRTAPLYCMGLGAFALGAPGEAPIGIEELYRLDRLPAFKQSAAVASISSYDRTGGNDDGFSGTYSFVRPFISSLVEIPVAGVYRISVEAARGPAQGKVGLFIDETLAGEVADFYAAERSFGPPAPLGAVRLSEGVNAFMFKLVGKDERATGAAFDLRNIVAERVE